MFWLRNKLIHCKFIHYIVSIALLCSLLFVSSNVYADFDRFSVPASQRPRSLEEALERRVNVGVHVDFTGTLSSYERQDVWIELYAENYAYQDFALLDRSNEWRHIFTELPLYYVPGAGNIPMSPNASLASPSEPEAFYQIDWKLSIVDNTNAYTLRQTDIFTWVLRPRSNPDPGVPTPSEPPSSTPGESTSSPETTSVPPSLPPETTSASPSAPSETETTPSPSQDPLLETGGSHSSGSETSDTAGHSRNPDGAGEGEVSAHPDLDRPSARKEMEPEEKEKLESQLHFSIQNDIPAEHVPGTEHVLCYELQNTGEDAVEGIYIRAYMPTYMQFVSSDAAGSYGFVGGREHVTWYIEKLAGGERIEIGYRAAFGYCIAGEVSSEIRYEVLGAGPKPYANTTKDPAKIVQ